MSAVEELRVSDGKDATVKRRGDKDMRRQGGATNSRLRQAWDKGDSVGKRRSGQYNREAILIVQQLYLKLL